MMGPRIGPSAQGTNSGRTNYSSFSQQELVERLRNGQWETMLQYAHAANMSWEPMIGAPTGLTLLDTLSGWQPFAEKSRMPARSWERAFTPWGMIAWEQKPGDATLQVQEGLLRRAENVMWLWWQRGVLPGFAIPWDVTDPNHPDHRLAADTALTLGVADWQPTLYIGTDAGVVTNVTGTRNPDNSISNLMSTWPVTTAVDAPAAQAPNDDDDVEANPPQQPSDDEAEDEDVAVPAAPMLTLNSAVAAGSKGAAPSERYKTPAERVSARFGISGPFNGPTYIATAYPPRANVGPSVISISGGRDAAQPTAQAAGQVDAALRSLHEALNLLSVGSAAMVAKRMLTTQWVATMPKGNPTVSEVVLGWLSQTEGTQAAEPADKNGASYMLTSAELIGVLAAQATGAPSLSAERLLGVAGTASSIMRTAQWKKLHEEVAPTMGMPQFFRELYNRTGEPFRSVIACLGAAIGNSSISAVLWGPGMAIKMKDTPVCSLDAAGAWYEATSRGGDLHWKGKDYHKGTWHLAGTEVLLACIFLATDLNDVAPPEVMKDLRKREDLKKAFACRINQ